MILFFAYCCAAPVLAAASIHDVLRSLDFAHPACDQVVDLNTGGQNFVPIANDLPGVGEYNALTTLYSSKKWDDLTAGIRKFRKTYETSPLVEAAQFLSVQAEIDQLLAGANVETKTVEKHMREVMVLYPKSTLSPMIVASMANYWLQTGHYEKAHALYRSAREDYPFHELACLFQFGVAESAFLLSDLSAAKSSFISLLQKCENPRLRLGAELRMVDMEWGAGKRQAANRYQKIYDHSAAAAPRHFPSLLYHLGEAKYREKSYQRAKFFFDEYVKSAVTKPSCVSLALKRIADISFHQKAPLATVVGNYLVVKEKAAGSDMGRFANVEALLLGISLEEQPERERRLKVIDEEIEKINDTQTRSLAFLHKGVALVGLGNASALDYLIRLSERTNLKINQGLTGKFLREHALGMLKTRLAVAKKDDEEKDFLGKLETAEKTYDLWLEGTPQAAKGREIYLSLVLTELESELGNANVKAAVALLKRSIENGVLTTKTLDATMKKRIEAVLLKSLSKATEPEALALSLLKDGEKPMEPFLPSLTSVWTVTRFLASADVENGKARQIASIPPGLSKDVTNFLNYTNGRILIRQGKYREAEVSLSRVKGKPHEVAAQLLRIEAFRKQGEFGRAFSMQKARISILPVEEQRKEMISLKETLMEGKLWGKADELVKMGERAGLEGKDLGLLYHALGLSYYEQAKCKPGVEALEKALVLDPTGKDAAGTKFRLGKCLVKTGKPAQARRVWEELSSQNDSFWSPLARNEIRLIDR